MAKATQRQIVAEIAPVTDVPGHIPGPSFPKYFATVSGFRCHRTNNLLHTPLDYIAEKFGLSYLDSENDLYVLDLCFEAAIESH